MKSVSGVGRLKLFALLCALFLSGCQSTLNSPDSSARLDEILDSRSADQKQRDTYRHPKQTLQFFGIQPGMTVVEVLPGGGWYSRILAPYLGSVGQLHAVNYADNMWSMFGFFSEERIAERKQQMLNWANIVTEYGGNGTSATGFAFSNVPKELHGSADAVLMIRALHNLNRFEEQASTRTQALQDVYSLLKPGGIVGVVQHRAPEHADNEWASGRSGYLKTSTVIQMFEQQGFTLLASSEINANPKDLPSKGDIVWRLPPSLTTSKQGSSQRTLFQAIGESDRMTLKFIKAH